MQVHANLLSPVVPMLIEQVTDIFDKQSSLFTKVFFDMQKCRDIDSRGVGFVISLYKTLSMEGKDLILQNVHQDIIEVFQIVKMDEYLIIHNQKS